MNRNEHIEQVSFLLVANFDSGVGYAWWLMESFWVVLADKYHHKYKVILAYPSISTIPPTIMSAPLTTDLLDFSGTSLKDVLAQCRFLLKNRVKVIYFSDKESWHWRYIAYRLSGVRHIIIHDHTPGLRTRPRGLKKFIKLGVHRVPGLSVDAAIGATDFVRDRLVQVNGIPPERCFSAPNGLPSLSLSNRADLHHVFNIPVTRKILIMTGRANFYKGVDFVLTCIAALNREYRDKLHFLFIGDGPDLVAFKELAEQLNVSGHCTFAGRRNDIPSLLEGADFAVHPSLGEVGYSLSVLEYMQAGLPVIVPDNPSVCGATIHMENGLIYPAGDVLAATSLLEKLLDGGNVCAYLSKQARERSADYSLEKTHITLLSAVKQTLSH